MKETQELAKEPLEVIAARKGHIPTPGPIRFRGDIHKGPHIAVVLQHSGLAPNSLLTEADYDKLVTEAYSLTLTERG
jgi:hypothetical protein